MEVTGDTCHFYHSGKITVGNISRGIKADLRELVQKKCPELIHGDCFYFGSLVHDRLWRLDDPEVIKIIRNMICYAEIANEYREHRKRTYKKKS
ncbi:MAG: hypothetical protein K2G25_06090 [Oscillospiraceae bacterium]|nr:hypothetical protein [Oscillospiraceae bacterium]